MLRRGLFAVFLPLRLSLNRGRPHLTCAFLSVPQLCDQHCSLDGPREGNTAVRETLGSHYPRRCHLNLILMRSNGRILDDPELLEQSSPRGRFCFFSGILNRDLISKKSSSSSILPSPAFHTGRWSLMKEFVDEAERMSQLRPRTFFGDHHFSKRKS